MSKRGSSAAGLQPLVNPRLPSDETEEEDTVPLPPKTLPPPGTLTRVRMINLRCHRHCELLLAPRVNFICGLNGSGKSTVLLAISLCLGSKIPAPKAKDKGLIDASVGHSVVRSGSHNAEVEIEMINGA